MSHIIKVIRKDIRLHFLEYALFTSTGILLVIGLLILEGQRTKQFILLSAFTVGYIILGVYHHISHENLHIKHVLEYVLIGFTVLFLLSIITIP